MLTIVKTQAHTIHTSS